MNKPIRMLALQLLDTSEGIHEQVWLELAEKLKSEGKNEDILSAVQKTNKGRFNLPLLFYTSRPKISYCTTNPS